MKISMFFAFMVLVVVGYSQSLPFDFESTPTTNDFIDFDGGTATVLPNPQIVAPNESANVAQIVRDGGAIWAGSKIILSDFLDFTTNGGMSMKVFSPVAGIIVKFKLEGNANTERDALTTVANQWETLTWDFTGEPGNTYNTVVFMFDFGNTGNGSANSTFLFDDVEQLDLTGGLSQIDLPVTFQDPTVFYEVTDFGGNSSVLDIDPLDGNNRIIITTKTVDAATWAGTTISTPAGFKNPIPISASETTMSVRVYSPDAGIPVRLKIEDHTDPTKSVETEALTTVANTWETLVFDFNNEAPGTAALNLGYTFDMASIFFNFGTDGSTAGERIYYWDDVYFGDLSSIDELNELGLEYYPNPVKDYLQISADYQIEELRIFNQMGQMVLFSKTDSDNLSIDLSKLSGGHYFVNVKMGEKKGTFKVLKVE